MFVYVRMYVLLLVTKKVLVCVLVLRWVSER